MSVIITIICVILILSLLLLSHELGHFLLARYHNIAVKEFSIGFGPAIFQKLTALPIFRCAEQSDKNKSGDAAGGIFDEYC